MVLSKRDCSMEMRVIPYGAGWTDVYFNINGDSLYFIISSVGGDQFSALLEVLYYLHPNQCDPKKNYNIDYWHGICRDIDGESVVVKIMEHCEEDFAVVQFIPHKAELH